MIHSSNVRKVIDNFKKVLPFALKEGSLDMSRASVPRTLNECGTPCCHAGWYALATSDFSTRLRGINFVYGVQQMDIDLELPKEKEDSPFTLLSRLARYMNKHSEIWGNGYGGKIFLHQYAFIHEDKRPNGAENLQHIIDHWEEVYLRLYTLENPTQITQPPVTAEDIMQDMLHLGYAEC